MVSAATVVLVFAVVTEVVYLMSAAKSLMTSFYVNHKSDAALLNDVKRRICKMHGERPPEVLVGAFTEERYHVEPDKAQTHHPTLMDQLMVDNNIVFNCLVDQVSVEIVY